MISERSAEGSRSPLSHLIIRTRQWDTTDEYSAWISILESDSIVHQLHFEKRTLHQWHSVSLFVCLQRSGAGWDQSRVHIQAIVRCRGKLMRGISDMWCPLRDYFSLGSRRGKDTTEFTMVGKLRVFLLPQFRLTIHFFLSPFSRGTKPTRVKHTRILWHPDMPPGYHGADSLVPNPGKDS